MLKDLIRKIPGARLVIRKLRRKNTSYWESRSGMKYYREVFRLVWKYAPNAKGIIDIGSFHAPFINRFSWIPDKTSLDLRPGKLEGVKVIKADFLKWKPKKIYDVVLCLQVLEHLENPSKFARKLLKTGKVIIISVPYRWKRGIYHRHVQDPVDEEKLKKWVGRKWDEQLVVRDNELERLIVVFKRKKPHGGVLTSLSKSRI